MKKFPLFILLSVLASTVCANDDFATIKKQAEQGNAAAQFDLATLYDEGEGVKRDLKKATKWYRQAAEQGEVAAQYNLAIMYDTGEGVTQDIIQAYAWMATAEMFGYQNAKESSKDFLSRMTPEQLDTAEALVIKTVNRITQRHRYYPMKKPGDTDEEDQSPTPAE